jgi:hypothetical protein
MGGMMRKAAVKTGVVKAIKFKDSAGKAAPKEVSDVGKAAMSRVVSGKLSSGVQNKASGVSGTSSLTKAGTTAGVLKKKKRLRDGRRSLISGSAMGVSDKLG